MGNGDGDSDGDNNHEPTSHYQGGDESPPARAEERGQVSGRLQGGKRGNGVCCLLDPDDQRRGVSNTCGTYSVCFVGSSGDSGLGP